MGDLQMVQAREAEHRYSVEHWGDEFYIITNRDQCVNSKLVKTPIAQPGKANWQEVDTRTPAHTRADVRGNV